MSVASGIPQSVMGRVTALLEPFRDAERLTLTELSQRTGFPRSSAHRLLLQLVQVGWIRRDGRSYLLGPKIVELGALARTHDRIHAAALPMLHRLWRSTGLAVRLATLEGENVLYLEQVGGRWTATLPTHPGDRLPARTTPEGAALLALPGTTSAVLVRSGPVPPAHAATGSHLHCVAAAFDAGRGESAALSVIGPAGRLPDDATPRLHEAARAVATLLAADRIGPSRAG